ncbi:MAG TPA: DUF1641 domain-containing protein [Acidobacteriaceae bacterium]|jgi:uncharacterized protein YjgD (DUF1641 family)|nr:DUF1641 domain-containing protein [Acidobacteriaceae bacterium]
MAQPIPLEIAPRDPRKELLARLEKAPEAHAAALLDSFELLQALHDTGILELLRGMVTARDKVLDEVVTTANTPEAINALRNAIIFGKMIASVNPELMESFAAATAETLGSRKKPVIDPPGLFSLLAQFRRKELRRSVALINRFLESLGNQLKLKGSPTPKD